jgi:DNA-binding transcriptional regulator Cro
MTPTQAISYFGTQAQMAFELRVTPQVVNNWKKRGRIPLAWQIDLETLSNGKLKLDRKRRNGGK